MADASRGRFATERDVFERWDQFRDWATLDHASTKIGLNRLGPAILTPTQVFGVGVNYHSHLAEAGLPLAAPALVFVGQPCAAGAGDADEVPHLHPSRKRWRTPKPTNETSRPAAAREDHRAPAGVPSPCTPR